jgi:hypothetical protein
VLPELLSEEGVLLLIARCLEAGSSCLSRWLKIEARGEEEGEEGCAGAASCVTKDFTRLLIEKKGEERSDAPAVLREKLLFVGEERTGLLLR